MPDKPRETVYDAEIAPLMAKIIRICREHNIPMAAHFELDPDPTPDNPLYCSTVFGDDHSTAKEHFLNVRRAVIDGKSPPPSMMSIVVTKGREA
jgi:hypothetical protein